MQNRVGLCLTIAVIGLAGGILFANRRSVEPPGAPGAGIPGAAGPGETAPPTQSVAPATQQPTGAGALAGVERPVGSVEKAHMQIASCYLPPIEMEGLTLPQDRDVIHLEADIHAIEGNPNGFAVGEWIPYLTVRYRIIPEDAKIEPVMGTFDPMVAKDGPHYGATIRMPGPGKYRLVYELEPPSVNGFGRHTDPITGVGPWWEKFSVEFSFDYSPVQFPSKRAEPSE
jgi:hypothetical protein